MGGPLGTLIVVVLKARNLPNKQRIGKQDPYATCTYLSHRKRTKTDKRGGQHPVWDDELRFEIYDNAKDAMASASVSTTATGGVGPLKSKPTPVGTTGTTSLKELHVAVYADDPRDPDFIGEGRVDLSETLKKGEFDDWVTMTNKGKYQGEVYLEMTFYSAKPPPEKLKTPTGPIRAGVFESTSPGSGLRPSASPSNQRKSVSPSGDSAKPCSQDALPAALRIARPTSGPISTAQLPLPGQPSTSKDLTLNSSRQRSTGSLSIPTPDFVELLQVTQFTSLMSLSQPNSNLYNILLPIINAPIGIAFPVPRILYLMIIILSNSIPLVHLDTLPKPLKISFIVTLPHPSSLPHNTPIGSPHPLIHQEPLGFH